MRVGIDFETYYDKECSLTKLAPEEYLTHPAFHIIGAALMVDHPGNMKWIRGPQLEAALALFPWPEIELVGHNLAFDGAILAWRYGIKPKIYIDTMALSSRFVTPYAGSAALAKVAAYLDLPAKGQTLAKMKGVGLHNLAQYPGLEDELARYALNDIYLSWLIADKFWDRLNWTEQTLQSWAVRNALEAKLDLDLPLLRQHHFETKQARDDALLKAGLDDPALLRSAKRFAEHLRELNVEVEYKDGKAEGVLVPALAKDDPFMRQLLEHPDDAIRFAAEARLAFASNLELTRTERFIRHAEVTGGQLMVSLRYWAAHTGRFGGANRMNLQNLGRKSKLRRAIKAKPGRRIVAVDASQIEARLVAWVSNCQSLLAAFRAKRDPYCEFGSGLFHRTITGADTIERQISKVAVLQLGYGSGAAKLKFKLDNSGVPVTQDQAQGIVDYHRREAYPEIKDAWYGLERLLRSAIQNQRSVGFPIYASQDKDRTRVCIALSPGQITLPDGTALYYDKMHIDTDEQIVYWSHRYHSWQKLYGGAIMENICQTMARQLIAVVHALLHHNVVLQVHDELVQEVAEERAEECKRSTIDLMSRTPTWAWNLPLAAEGWIGTEYVKP